MTDLCYNCGDCHLPNPCSSELRKCDICQNLGHTYNFCPLSVRHKDSSYQFWALCHNCDKWHLPEPCGYQLYQCKQCGNCGHLEHFCPVNPTIRDKGQPGMKRQRTEDSGYSGTPSEPVYESRKVFVHPDLVRQMKLNAVYETLNLLNTGHSQDQIMGHMSRPVSPPRPNGMVILPIKGDSNVKTEAPADPKKEDQRLFVSGSSNGRARQHAKQQATVQPATPGTPTPLRPTTTTGSMSQTATDGGVYMQMHERFNRGDLAHVLNAELSCSQVAAAENNNSGPGRSGNLNNGIVGEGDGKAASQPSLPSAHVNNVSNPGNVRHDSAVQGNDQFQAPNYVGPFTEHTSPNNADSDNGAFDNGLDSRLDILAQAMAGHQQQFHQAQDGQSQDMAHNNPLGMFTAGHMPNPFFTTAFTQPPSQPPVQSQEGNGVVEDQGHGFDNNIAEEPKVELTKKGLPKKKTGRKKKT